MIPPAAIAEKLCDRLILDGIPCTTFGAEEDDDGLWCPFVVCDGRYAAVKIKPWDDWSKLDSVYETIKQALINDREMRKDAIGHA